MATKDPKPGTTKTAASQYTAAELAKAAGKVFGVPQDVVTAALRMAGVKSATVEEAKKVVAEFAKREVK